LATTLLDDVEVPALARRSLRLDVERELNGHDDAVYVIAELVELVLGDLGVPCGPARSTVLRRLARWVHDD
jgi:hypothetical protein